MYCLIVSIFFSYIGKKTKQKRFLGPSGKPKPPVDEARDLLANVILAHVPVRCCFNHSYIYKKIFIYFLNEILFNRYKVSTSSRKHCTLRLW
jgi:hypothetical protein